jgi:PPP family 3-phenylpropionic acid transporter
MTPSVASRPSLAAMVSIGAFYFFYFVLVGVYIIYLPKMLTQQGFNATQVGIIYAAAPMMRFLLPFIFRRFLTLDDRVYRVALGLMFGASLFFTLCVHSFGLYLTVNLLYGAAMGAVLPYVDTIALQIITQEHYGKVRLWGSIGFIVIALWLGQVLGGIGQTFGYLMTASLLTTLTGLYLVRFDPHRDAPVDRESERAFSLSKYWAFWVSAFLLQVSFGGFYNFFTIYEAAHGFSQATISYLWSFGVLIEIAMLYFQGPLLRRNLLRVIQFATLTAIIRWAMLWLWPDVLAVSYASQTLHAFSFALYYTATIAYVFQLYTQKKLAQQFYLGMTFGLGGSVGAVLGGWVYDWHGEWLFLFSALMALAALGMMFLHEHRRRRGDALG